MGMKINDRNARRMMERMGINQKEVPDVEEVARETKKFSDEDIILVQQQANVTREKAVAALEQSDGEVAKAILLLTS